MMGFVQLVVDTPHPATGESSSVLPTVRHLMLEALFVCTAAYTDTIHKLHFTWYT